MIGIIDIGSNTVRMNVYQVNNNEYEVLFSSKEMAGLAAQIESGLLMEKGYQNLIRILKRFKETIDSLQIKEVYAFATASLRLISNQQTVLGRIESETGFTVDLIDGEEEGRLGVLGALSNLPVKKAVLMDLGGGSCELVPFDQGQILSSVSYPIGSLSLYKNYVSGLLPTLDEQKSIKKFVKKQIDVGHIVEEKFVSVIGVGGTMRALLKLNAYLLNDYKSSQLTLQSLKAMLKILNENHREAQDIILKTIPDRIHTIMPGLCAIIAIMQAMGTVEILVSNNGVREGYLMKHVLKRGDGFE